MKEIFVVAWHNGGGECREYFSTFGKASTFQKKLTEAIAILRLEQSFRPEQLPHNYSIKIDDGDELSRRLL